MIKQKLAFIFFFMALLAPQFCWAGVNLSLNSVDGSNTLRFRSSSSGMEDKKEVRVRINATGGQRYQVFQRLNGPLTNEKGESLDPRVLKVATVFNSNTSGSLYLQNIESLGMGEQLIYASGQTGESDSFSLVYTIDSSALNDSGNFMGRLVLTVRAMGEAAQEQASLNVEIDSQSSWKLDVSGGNNKVLVRVKDTDTSVSSADYARINFSGGNGREVRIYQEFETLPRNSAGDEMLPEVLKFAVEGSSAQGVRAVDPSAAGRNRVLIYAGHDREASIAVRYLMDAAALAAQDAGTYIGRVRYSVETDSGREALFMDMECTVQPVFTVDVTLPPEGINFEHLQVNAAPIEHAVDVSVRSNLHRPYRLVQELQTPMTNEKGDQIKKEYFTLKVELPAGDRGRTKFADYAPVETGSYPVFTSDAKGSPSVFRIWYRLQGYPQMSPGNFSAPIRFSLDQD
jgi:hypothetical protein